MGEYIEVLKLLEKDNSNLRFNYKKGKITKEKYERESDKNRLDAITKILKSKQ